MSTIKKMFGLSAAVVLAAMAFGASSAAAADTATCAFTGLAGGLNPPIPAANKFPIGLNQTGTYNFSGPGTCVALEGDTGDAPTNSGVYNVAIVSAGNYKNTICGTGEAHGVDPNATTVTFVGAPASENPVHATYDINFTGGAGAMRITGGSTPQHGSLTGGGYVQIVPQDGNCADTDVRAFTVAGAFSAVAS